MSASGAKDVRTNAADEQPERQRLDKWLWFARVVRTRPAAAKLVSDGYVRVNSRRVDSPAKSIVPGDVLTVALEHQVRVLKVVATGLRRGRYEQARTLFEELPLTPPEALSPAPVSDRGGAPDSRRESRPRPRDK